MNIIIKVFMLGILSMYMFVECSDLSVVSAPLLLNASDSALDVLPDHIEMDVIPPLPLKQEQKNYLGDESAEVVSTESEPLPFDVRAKKFIMAVIFNDDAAFMSLFNGDLSDRCRLARQRFMIMSIKSITPLHLASKNGNELMVKALVSNGADVTAELRGGFTPVVIASKAGHVGIVDFFSSLPVRLDYDRSLVVAITQGHLPVVKTILNQIVYNQVDLNHAENFARTEGKIDIADYISMQNDRYLQKRLEKEESCLQEELKKQEHRDRFDIIKTWLANVNHDQRETI